MLLYFVPFGLTPPPPLTWDVLSGCPHRGNLEFPVPDPENPGKTGNSRNLHVTYQMKALGTLVHLDTSKFQNSGKILKNSRKTGKFQKKHIFVARRATTREYNTTTTPPWGMAKC